MEQFVFTYHPRQRERFRDKELSIKWHARYPQIFDDDDLRLAQSQPGNHFYEWLAAIMLYEATGYLSLVEKWSSQKHQRKREIYERLAPKQVVDLLDEKSSGHPDLFAFQDDGTDWFFCEVKGGKDRIRPAQRERFAELREISGTVVRVVELQELRL